MTINPVIRAGHNRMILLEIITFMMQCTMKERQMEKTEPATIPGPISGYADRMIHSRGGLCRPALVLFFLFIVRISSAAPVFNVSDTEPVVVRDSPENGKSMLVETSMLLDFGAVPSAKFFASRKPAQNVELLWGGSARLLVEHRDEKQQIDTYRGMDFVKLERHIAMYPRDAEALMVYGVRLYQTNQIEQCLLVLERARQVDPEMAQISELSSGVLVRSGNFKRAASHIRELLDTHPDNRVIRFNAACAYALNDNIEECMYHLKILAQTGWTGLAYHMGDTDLKNVSDTEEFGILHDLMLQEARSQLNRMLLSSMYIPEL